IQNLDSELIRHFQHSFHVGNRDSGSIDVQHSEDQGEILKFHIHNHDFGLLRFLESTEEKRLEVFRVSCQCLKIHKHFLVSDHQGNIRWQERLDRSPVGTPVVEIVAVLEIFIRFIHKMIIYVVFNRLRYHREVHSSTRHYSL
ncbi:hypothetical protein PFISCL1PPCAC_12297, partial [Pristionchus fissidentatus]